MAKRKRHTDAEIASKLTLADEMASSGKTQDEIAHGLGISVMTFHRWRKLRPQLLRDAGPSGPVPTDPTHHFTEEDLQRVAELRVENARLRKLVTDLLLEKMRLEEEAQHLGARGAASRAHK